MRPALRRIWGLAYRHFALYRRSWPRLLELMYFPVLQMLIWGFMTAWITGAGAGRLPAGGAGGLAVAAAGALLGGVLLWEVALRSQMGFAISFLEEVWSRNLGHLFVSPLRPGELLAALMGVSLIRMLIGVLPAMALAWLLYGFGIWTMGPVLVPFVVALMLMGWAVALGVTAMVLRHGAGAESLAWSILFGIAPFSAVFYPVSALPDWVQPIALLLPATHVFEGMRAALLDGRVAWEHLGAAFALDAVWLAALGWVFLAQFRRARRTGALLGVGE